MWCVCVDIDRLRRQLMGALVVAAFPQGVEPAPPNRTLSFLLFVLFNPDPLYLKARAPTASTARYRSSACSGAVARVWDRSCRETDQSLENLKSKDARHRLALFSHHHHHRAHTLFEVLCFCRLILPLAGFLTTSQEPQISLEKHRCTQHSVRS